ncbi:MAG: hypothetical protein ABI963_13295 [Rhizomicrobium sp.]
MTDRRVCIVLNREFGTNLRNLEKSVPIWIVQSATNDPVIAEFWKTKTGNITSFLPQEFKQLVDTVDQHHPGWCELEVHGLSATSALAVLGEIDGGAFNSTIDGFVFEKPIQ